MSLEISLPFGKKDNAKNLVFSILTNEYPLKIIELTNFIKKRYGKTVTFQAVRKAILGLVDENVLIKKGNSFSINKEWVKESKDTLNRLYDKLNMIEVRPKNIDSIEGEVTVITFDSLNELMKYWQELIDGWYKKFKKGDYNLNCFQGTHSWEGLLHPDKEKTVMGQLKRKNIISYAIATGNTPLDRNIAKFYNSIGLKYVLRPSMSHFDRTYYVATYGDIIIQVHYPDKLANELELFFKKNKKLEDLNLKELSDIVNKQIKIKLTIIKNLDMAKQINQSILTQIDM